MSGGMPERSRICCDSWQRLWPAKRGSRTHAQGVGRKHPRRRASTYSNTTKALTNGGSRRFREAFPDNRILIMRLKRVSANRHMHTYMHACMHTCIHAYMHTCIHAYMHTCIHAYVHAYMHTCIHAYVHTCVHACVRACIHIHIHTYIHTYIRTYVLTCIRTFIGWLK